MTAVSKGDAQSIVVGRGRIGLVFDAGLIETVATNGARIGANIPTPHGDGVPFFDFKAGAGGFGGLCIGSE